MFRSLIPIAQITISVIIVIAILLQPSTAGVGGTFGGGDGVSAFRTKRGFEKFIFIATIVLGAVFAALGVLAILF